MKRILTLIISGLMVLGGMAQVANYVINTQQPQQTIRHFGASDAWSMKYVGLWPEQQQEQIADWLFSQETDAQGKPLGIGLSLWRFNLGAGSEEQGREAGINRSTRTECLLGADGTYNWDKQQGERHFMRLAKERGVPYFLAFLNSVPVYFTKNGLATNTGRGGTINLREECYGLVAEFIATALEGLEQRDGIHFDYVSPVNEPDGHWNWLGPKQEGSPATNREIARLVDSINHVFERKQLTTQIMVNESSDLRCLLGIYQTTWERGNTIRTLFGRDSTATFLGHLSHVAPTMVAHSYWTNTPVPYMKKIRQELRDTLRHYGIGYWQSELCIMSNDEEIGGGHHFDFTMRTALYVARVIHHDLVYANAESWSWWRALGGDYRDGLIRVFSDDRMRTGRAVDSKLMWCMGNYSRFVRPGAVRYDVVAKDRNGNSIADGETDPTGVMASAYKNQDGSWVVVVINYAEEEKPFAFALSSGSPQSWKMYRTSDIEGESLLPVGHTAGQASLPPRSITTLVSD